MGRRHGQREMNSYVRDRRVLKPSQLNALARDILEGSFAQVWVEGEISNFSRPASGHLYFTLKDDRAQVRCAMFRSKAMTVRFAPRDGLLVQARGKLTLYEARGECQLVLEHLEEAGEGALRQAFEQLKARLAAEGLFAPERKRPLPRFVRRLGVITSPRGAAVRDVLSVLERRLPLLEVEVLPVPVQGEGAACEILAQLHAALRSGRYDALLLTRGGGSLEDLWCFNDEDVVRAIAASPVVVVSGVGHETDFTLADFAADLRAPTPSAAAELVAPDMEQLQVQVSGLAARLAGALLLAVRDRRWALAQQAARLRGLSPLAQLRAAQQRVDDLQARAASAIGYRVSLDRQRLRGLTQALNTISPLAVLQRGYAIVTGPGGALLRSTAQARPGDRLSIRVGDGSFPAAVAED
jgi:exodeoxyribonuclease VII large subunit